MNGKYHLAPMDVLFSDMELYGDTAEFMAAAGLSDTPENRIIAYNTLRNHLKRTNRLCDDPNCADYQRVLANWTQKH